MKAGKWQSWTHSAEVKPDSVLQLCWPRNPGRSGFQPVLTPQGL